MRVGVGSKKCCLIKHKHLPSYGPRSCPEAQTVLAHPFYQDVEGEGRKRMAVELALRALNFGLLVEFDSERSR
jgi:hypothetical protein